MSSARLGLWWKRTRRKVFLRATVYGALGVATALFGAWAKSFIPEAVAGMIGADSVGGILTILASSMLAVTTFSLSTMVAAYSAAASSATPRATTLLIADRSAQGALATFIGAFLFSVVGLIALSTGIYGDSGRVVLFAATVLVVVVITVTLLRWIDRLSSFGRVGTTINLVEDATAEAVRAHLDDPWLGATPAQGAPPEGAAAIEHARIGYVDLIDVAELDALARAHGCAIHVAIRPGGFAAPGRTIAWVAGAPADDALADSIRAAVRVGDERTFDQDPRFGFVVLTEIGSRALSAAINDPGTAIDVIGTLTRLLCRWGAVQAAPERAEVRYRHVHMPGVAAHDLFDDIFPPLARDGAGILEVGIRLQKCLAAIARCASPAFSDAARAHADAALARAQAAMAWPDDADTLTAVHRDGLHPYPAAPGPLPHAGTRGA